MACGYGLRRIGRTRGTDLRIRCRREARLRCFQPKAEPLRAPVAKQRRPSQATSHTDRAGRIHARYHFRRDARPAHLAMAADCDPWSALSALLEAAQVDAAADDPPADSEGGTVVTMTEGYSLPEWPYKPQPR